MTLLLTASRVKPNPIPLLAPIINVAVWIVEVEFDIVVIRID